MIGLWKRWKEAREHKYQQAEQKEIYASQLFDTAMNEDTRRAEQLLKAGVNIDARNSLGETPLHRAVQGRQVEMVRFLLERGANPNLATYGVKRPPLMYVKGKEPVCLEILSLLLEHKADLHRRDCFGQNVLNFVAFAGNIEGMKLLLAHGAKVNKKGIPPLVSAAGGGHLDIVKLLLGAGASVKNNQALRGAAAAGHTDVILTLLDAGADINEDAEALANAVFNANAETIRVMIERGAEVIASNSAMRRALKLVEQAGREDIAQMLREAGAKTSSG